MGEWEEERGSHARGSVDVLAATPIGVQETRSRGEKRLDVVVPRQVKPLRPDLCNNLRSRALIRVLQVADTVG